MRLAGYLARIGFEGAPRVDLETLRRLHHAHLRAIPYENLDVALRRPVTRDPAAAYEKIVAGRRGGWCYEMNGLLAWALEEIGFSVTRMAGGVHRASLGEQMVGNHLVLRVDLDRPYIADVGFGDGLIEPAALVEGPITQRGLSYRLDKLDERWWRFHNHVHGGAPSFDFVDEPADPALLQAKCEWLQADGSPFVANVIVQRHTIEGVAAMRNATLRLVSPDGVDTQEIADLDSYVGVLKTVFALEVPFAPALWEKIEACRAAA
jgi:N-hydroxyarylamine O-acetyltransferase